MELTKEEKKALKLAIESLKHVRKEFHAVGSNLYKDYDAETQKKHFDKYQEYSEAIEVLERWLK